MSPKPRTRRAGAKDAYQIGPGTLASLSYELFDAEGEKLEQSDPEAPLEVLFGAGEVAPAVERALEGLSEGALREVRLPPREAFGERDPEAILEVDRADLPADLEPGDEFLADREDGEGAVLLKVIEVAGDVVLLDANHPLAGQHVRLVFSVLSVRPATEEELRLSAERLSEEAAREEGPLLPAERLLRRRRGEAPGGGDEPPPPKRVA